MTNEPRPFEPRHIVLGERLTDAWLRDDHHEAQTVFNEILPRFDDLVTVLEYLVGALAVERIMRLGEDQAVEQTEAVIAELSEPQFPRPKLIRVKAYGTA
jgi:hypothetical protein